MKFQTMSTVALAALVNVSTANFDIYMVDETTTIDPQAWAMWHIWDADPSCDDVMSSSNPNYLGSDDVSGGVGVRCDADNLLDCAVQSARADAIKELELNFAHSGPVYHWTLYQDRNYDLTGLDDNVYGNCFPFPGNSYDCNDGLGGFTGTRKFRCITEFTASQIKAAWGS